MGSRHIKTGHTKTPRPVPIEKVFKYAVLEIQLYVGNDQEKSQSVRNSHSKNRGRKKLN